VSFFFVLSGFIIFYVHETDFGVPRKALPYLAKRFFRIYPLYWVLLVLVLPIFFIFSSLGSGHERELGTLLSSFFLFSFSPYNTALTVAWSLHHEIMFYLLFCVLILNKKAGLITLGLWMSGSIYLYVMSGMDIAVKGSDAFSYWFSPYHLLFAMGMGCCWLTKRKLIPYPEVWAWIGLLVFISTGVGSNYFYIIPDSVQIMLYGGGAAVSLAGFLILEEKGALRGSRLWERIGDASYSIYLVHVPALSLLLKSCIFLGIKKETPHVALLFLYIAIALITLLGGYLLHRFIEKPIIKKTRKLASFLQSSTRIKWF
jgi:peptidoglycan/LPS O-acetylase OafA/YrhL